MAKICPKFLALAVKTKGLWKPMPPILTNIKREDFLLHALRESGNEI